jgi:hypothetical protein
MIEPDMNGVTPAGRMDVGVPARDVKTGGGEASLKQDEFIQQT